MADLVDDVDDDLPDLIDLLRPGQGGVRPAKQEPITTTLQLALENPSSVRDFVPLHSPGTAVPLRTNAIIRANEEIAEKATRRRRPLLAMATDNTLLLPLSIPSTQASSSRIQLASSQLLPSRRNSPRRRVKQPVNYRLPHHSSDSEATHESSGDESVNSLADFVVDDDVSIEEADDWSSPVLPSRRRPAIPSNSLPSLRSQETDDSFHDEPHAVLKFSPSASRSPAKRESDRILHTPPPSPRTSKKKLISPTKAPHIPQSPHRPSIDAFWSQDVINEWNDQHSPRKTPRSKRGGARADEPPVSPSKLGGKKDKHLVESKADFNRRKRQVALQFLRELDEKVTSGRVGELAATTGGVQILWSKKLISTAGRANWKREAIRDRSMGGATVAPTYRHFASIELAEKVIDDEDRLINVIAHEYCHLANFMISGVKDCPHGKEFKEWASKCSRLFRSRGIEVTTKHSYAIAYKYMWECSKCGLEYKRHSKSIDTARQTCGACRASLVQTQPAPRNAAPTGYSLFVKEHFAAVKRDNPASPQKEIMKLLGAAYQTHKAAARRLEDLAVGGGDEAGEEAGVSEESDLKDVVRHLDFLRL
ncbi:MAG: hypothetical protein M1838_000407 [Thelocarpon superellum]|nr:MAG: hypothetical protein M1838_000407 [Thelocarpon superellum]